MFGQPRDPALDALEPLVGAWTTESTHPQLPGVIPGKATFEWLDGKQFMIWRSHHDTPNTVPSAIAIVGGAPVRPGEWSLHYFDDRGVIRMYTMSMPNGVWKFFREYPGFSQRWTGTFEDGGRVIRVKTELDEHGVWKPDLEQVYRRA
jgi:hypothetical protein